MSKDKNWKTCYHWQNLQHIEELGSLDIWESFPVFKSNSRPENDITEKLKVKTVGLIFHEVSKNVIVFDAAHWESAAFANLFPKISKSTLLE